MICYTLLSYESIHTGVKILKKVLYAVLFLSISILLKGCFNKEKKANDILDCFDEVEVIEEVSEEKLGEFTSEIHDITKEGDISMIRLIAEDVITTI